MFERAVLFDLDDTLLATYQSKWRQHKEAAKRYYETELSDDLLAEHWGKPTDEIVPILYGSQNKAAEMVAAYRSLDQSFPKMLHTSAQKLIELLREQSYYLGIVTNSSRRGAIHDLERLGLSAELFQSIVGFEDTNTYKPDPRVFDSTLSRLKELGIKDTVYVGDSLNDYIAAKSAGIGFIAVTSGVTAADAFEVNDVPIIVQSLDDLPAALGLYFSAAT